MVIGVCVSLYSYVGATYGYFGVTKADAPMYGTLAMAASLLVVALVSLVTAVPQKALVDKAFAATAATKDLNP